MRNVQRKSAASPWIVALVALFFAAQVQAGRNCGGLNESSCWHANPSKWCEGNLKYKPTGIPGKGTCVKRKPKPKSKPKSDCGGLNQSSCWSVNPTKWCQGDFQYKPTGVPGKGTCVSREKEHCGNLDQQSCWNVNPARWCNGGLKYKPTGVPGQGKCILRVSNDDLQEVAASVVEQLKNVGESNPLVGLRECLKQPGNLAALKRALSENSANGVNALLRQCNASPDALRQYGENVLSPFNSATASTGAARSRASALSSTSTADAEAWHLSLGALAGGVAKVGAEGGVGYRVTLRKGPDARFFVFGGVNVGVGLEGGADVAVGLDYGSMPTAHWARDVGVSVGYSGKAVYGGGVAVNFARDSIVPAGFTISGGAGAGAQVGVVTTTGTQYLHNFD